jgi:hypothetical protein
MTIPAGQSCCRVVCCYVSLTMHAEKGTSGSQIIDIRFGPLLPWTFHFVAGIAILFAIAIAVAHPWIALLFFLGALFAFTSFEGTEIDVGSKRFREYTSFFLMKTGEWIPFDEIEKIYVNKNKMRQQMSPSRTGLTTSITYAEFSAFVKFNEEEIVQLIKHKDKQKVMARAKVWSQQLNIPLYDNTGETD